MKFLTTSGRSGTLRQRASPCPFLRGRPALGVGLWIVDCGFTEGASLNDRLLTMPGEIERLRLELTSDWDVPDPLEAAILPTRGDQVTTPTPDGLFDINID